MPRGRRSFKKQETKPDIRYGDVRVAKFIKYLIEGGKKSLAEQIVYNALDKASKETGKTPLEVFQKAIENTGPLLEVRPMRVGGATYQVPYEVQPSRRFTLGAKWIIGAARKKQGKPMSDLLAEEIIAAYNNEGSAVKKKIDTHKMAEANKAFAHYARF